MALCKLLSFTEEQFVNVCICSFAGVALQSRMVPRRDEGIVKLTSCVSSCALLFLAGSNFAIGVLANAAASYQTWESSFSLMALVSAPAMVLTGAFMDWSDNAEQEAVSSKNWKTRLLVFMMASSFALLSLGSGHSTGMIVFAVAMQGVALGIGSFSFTSFLSCTPYDFFC